jgi:RNA polymerase sigma-70 factor, ECF subfamily
MEPPRPRPPLEDRELVERAQRGDPAAFRTLVERYQRRIVAHALSMVKDADEAMDIAQETFVRVHRYLPSFKGEASFFTWTWRISTNLCLDAARKKGRAERLGLPGRDGDDAREAELEARMDPASAALAGPLRMAENRELGQKMDQALAELSENHRSILLLREVDGLSYEELSKVLGIRKGTVMSRLFHARLKMQRKLREYLGGEAPEPKEARRDSGEQPVEGDEVVDVEEEQDG